MRARLSWAAAFLLLACSAAPPPAPAPALPPPLAGEGRGGGPPAHVRAPALPPRLAGEGWGGGLPVALPPLAGDPLITLDGGAVASLPLGASAPRPLLVAAHGAGDRPDWQCQVWRGIVGDRGFVLCPRGAGRFELPEVPGGPERRFHPGHPALGRAIDEALAALRARFEPYVDFAAPVFAGYSQGATMGSLLLPSHPARFTRAALVEGGFGDQQEWSGANARRFHDGGGVRVLIACGRDKCAQHGDTTAQLLRRSGLEVRLVHATGAGHVYDGAVAEQVREAFAWLIEGDTRW